MASVVVGGSNAGAAWDEYEQGHTITRGSDGDGDGSGSGSDVYLDMLKRSGAGVVLLQREVPEEVNLALANAAFELGVPVIQVRGLEGKRA